MSTKKVVPPKPKPKPKEEAKPVPPKPKEPTPAGPNMDTPETALNSVEQLKKMLEAELLETQNVIKEASKMSPQECMKILQAELAKLQTLEELFKAGAGAADTDPNDNDNGDLHAVHVAIPKDPTVKPVTVNGKVINGEAVDYVNAIGKGIADDILKSVTQRGSWPVGMQLLVQFNGAPPLLVKDKLASDPQLDKIEKIGAGMLDILAQVKAGKLGGMALAKAMADMDDKIADLKKDDGPDDCDCEVCQLRRSIESKSKVTADGLDMMRAFNDIMTKLKKS